MIKIILLLLFAFLSIAAEDKTPCCTTVQLISYVDTNKNLKLLDNMDYPSECKTMKINGYITVRCGCFKNSDLAKEKLKELKVEYPQANLVESYEYRFDQNCSKATTTSSLKPLPRESQENRLDDEELRLMVQVFLYKNDLENAYKIAQLGYQQNPNSYYWNEKMANILQWTDRPARSMKYLKKMYQLKYDPKLEQKLIEYGKATFQYESIEPYVLNKVRKNPSAENIDLLITIYKQTGFPEKAIAILDQEYKKTLNTLLISKTLELSIEMGDPALAKKYISILQAQGTYSKQDATLIAKYYYILRDIQHAVDVLEQAEHGDIFEAQDCSSNVEYLTKGYFSDECLNEIKYFELKSDLAWYLQKNLLAANASLVTAKSNVARLVDYERVAIVYQDINTTIASTAVKEGYLKYKRPHMFFSYANNAINKKKFDDLNRLIETIDEEQSPLVEEAMYWLIKSKVYNHYKKYDLEKMALTKSMTLSPHNTEIKVALLWHFIEMGDIENTRLILLEIEENTNVTPSLYFTLASGYFYIHDINKASYYMSALDFEQDIITKTLDYKFLQAYIYQIQNRELTFKSKMIEILKILKEQREQNPNLKKNNEYLTNYFNAAMHVMHAEKFEYELHEAKQYLKKKNYDELTYSWALQKDALANSHKIYNQTENAEQWMQFSDAIVMQHHTNVENFLERYLSELSQGDVVSQAREDGQLSLAQSTNYNFFDHNSYSQDSYIQQIELSKLRTDMLDLKLSRYTRNPLVQNYADIKNSSYIGDDWYILSGFAYYQNSSSDKNVLVNVPDTTYDVSLGVKKLTDRASIELDLLYNHNMENYFSMILDASYQLSTDLKAGLEIADNKRTDVSTQLYLGGKKDLVAPRLIYQILNSTTIEIQYEFSKFYSQDDVYLGKGNYFSTSINRQIRNGYPDMRIGLFCDNRQYSENSGSKGIINRLQLEQYGVLPNNFYNIGVNFSYGEVNKNLYTRVWRPYFKFFPYYNSDTQEYAYGFNAGIGGKVFHQDHMSIGATYTDSVNGVGGKIFEFYMNYQFLYTLSKGI